MRALYTFTIFLSAFLLFLVEPMVARMILPIFGGSAQVWNTCLVFFQGVLLLGYGYAHLSIRWLGPRHQWRLHLPLMAVALGVLVFQGFHAPTTAPSAGDPSIALLGILAVLIGLPFFAVSAGSSILQGWFASTDDKDAENPYFLYSASNVGSLLALLAYPALMEPWLGVQDQTTVWKAGLAVLIVGMGACATVLVWAGRRTERREPVNPTPRPSPKLRAQWVALAAIPSSLLLGVTTYLTTNIAPIPLLWVVPLALYLLTFILAFARKTIMKTEYLARLVPLILTPLALAIILESSEPLLPLAVFHLLGFFVAAWMCHSRLSDTKPDPSHLTEFFFWVALGGVVGGIFNALLAPLIFRALSEYPIAIVAACLMRPPKPADPRHKANIDSMRKLLESAGPLPPQVEQQMSAVVPSENRKLGIDAIYAVVIGLVTIGIAIYAQTHGYQPSKLRTMACIGIPAIACFLAVDRPIRYALSLGAVFAATAWTQIATDGTIILSARSFFGIHRVTRTDTGHFYRLTHGNTIHGMQDRDHPQTPLTYYYPNGPIGEAFKKFHGAQRKDNVALVGLGVGSLAAYGEPGQNMDFFEIDPVVRSIATDPNYFTFIRDSKANVRIIMGDARLSLANAPDHLYGMIVLDAFSSDAIPVHLLTEDAYRMYLQKLAPHGILCVHISNRFLDLSIPLGAIARDLGLKTSVNEDFAIPTEQAAGKTDSEWVYIVRDPADFAGLDSHGTPISVNDTTRAWTDDFSNVLSVFRPGK